MSIYIFSNKLLVKFGGVLVEFWWILVDNIIWSYAREFPVWINMIIVAIPPIR